MKTAATALLIATSILMITRVALAEKAPARTLGIASVLDELDRTSESFSLYRYLSAHPPSFRGRKLRVILVDHPAEADFSISGSIDGLMTFQGDTYSIREVAHFIIRASGSPIDTLHMKYDFDLMVDLSNPRDRTRQIRGEKLLNVWRALSSSIEDSLRERAAR